MCENIAPLSFSYYGQINDARQMANDVLGKETADKMSDSEIANWIDENYEVYCAYNDERDPGVERMANEQSIIVIEKSIMVDLRKNKHAFEIER